MLIPFSGEVGSEFEEHVLPISIHSPRFQRTGACPAKSSTSLIFSKYRLARRAPFSRAFAHETTEMILKKKKKTLCYS